ncbi:hypothetical protein LIER_37470 [Lithospermum erythrorhizon]|uniref:Uncharacterized protein n=1 Tax=Lithospermum erythrorhizon TaxID=34254 RepID=A0AAV3PMJ3_LITER
MNGRKGSTDLVRKSILRKKPILVPSTWVCLPWLPMVHVPRLRTNPAEQVQRRHHLNRKIAYLKGRPSEGSPLARGTIDGYQDTVDKCGGSQAKTIIEELPTYGSIPPLHRIPFIGGGVEWGDINGLSSEGYPRLHPSLNPIMLTDMPQMPRGYGAGRCDLPKAFEGLRHPRPFLLGSPSSPVAGIEAFNGFFLEVTLFLFLDR